MRSNKSSRASITGKIKFILALLLLGAWPVAISGQAQSTAPPEQMRALNFLLGEWKGKGWLYGLKGPLSEISQSVQVKSDPRGALLRIKDSKSHRDNRLAPGLGSLMGIPKSTISYDEQAKLYRWRVDAAKGRGNPFEVKLLEPRTLQLITHTGDGMARTTIRITEDGKWHETFELLLSEGWFKFQETVLRKVK
jgi:hypothetical protein